MKIFFIIIIKEVANSDTQFDLVLVSFVLEGTVEK